MLKAVKKINPKEDIDALISNNKSQSSAVKREEFQEYNANEMGAKFKSLDKINTIDRKQSVETLKTNEMRVI